MGWLLKLLSLAKSPAAKTVAGHAIGAGLGYAGGDWEAKHLYDKEVTGDLARLMGTGAGMISGGLIGKGKYFSPLNLGLLASVFGPKQIFLRGTEALQDQADTNRALQSTIQAYTAKQGDLMSKQTQTAESNLETAKQNKEIAEIADKTSREWLNIANKGLPFLGLAGLAGLGLYAYNSFKNPKKSGSDDVSLQIPSEKLSPKFYSRLGREILFQDKEEKGRLAKRKLLKSNPNLTEEEIDRFLEENPELLKTAAETPINQQSQPVAAGVAQKVSESNPDAPGAAAEAATRANDELNNSWTTPINRFIIKYAPPVLEHFGLITPSEVIKQQVSLWTPEGKYKVPSTGDPQFQGINGLNTLLSRVKQISLNRNPYYNGKLGYF